MSQFNRLTPAQAERLALMTLLDELGEKLQQVCTIAADNIPVAPGGEPWGCILTSEGQDYCDHCPVLKYCPSKRKEWSK